MPAHPLGRWCDVCQHVHPAMREPAAAGPVLRDRIEANRPIRLSDPAPIQEEVQFR